METNFFKSIQALQVAGNWKINIAREDTDRLMYRYCFLMIPLAMMHVKKYRPFC